MKKFLSICFLLLGMKVASAQSVKISFAGGANLPLINDVIEPRLTPITNPSTGFFSTTANIQVDQKFETLPSLQGSVNFSFPLDNKLTLSTGLGATHYRFIQKFIVASNFNRGVISGVTSGISGAPINIIKGTPANVPNNGTVLRNPLFNPTITETPSDQGKTSATYLTIPATLDYRFAKKWTVSAGLNAHVIMAAKVNRYEYTYNVNGGVLQVEDRSADGFTNVLLSTNSAVRYQIVKAVSIELGYGYTLTPIYDKMESSISTDQARYMTFSFGARYWLKP
jgi:Outer membrane protein beta-barrel domain